MFDPVSTYRIQFHKDFTFEHFEKAIPYLSNLGIKTLYASPIFSAVPGSNHGYDGVDPLSINPEIGTLDQLKEISSKLKAAGINWLQDIVPNHMAFHHHNKWLMDLLEKGPLSAYRNYFDQSLADDLYEGPIMVPFLGDDLDKVIEAGDLKIDWYENNLVLKYAEQIWPLNIRSYQAILQTDEPNDSVKQLLNQISEINEVTDAETFALRGNEFKLQLTSLAQNEEISNYFKNRVETVNNDKQQLLSIAKQQYYRLCNWQETDKQINFRRFFTVNGLICLNIQDEKVFNHVHEFVSVLLKDGIIQGLRIDHIDGLYDPTQYLQRLRALSGDDTYIVVEKILEPGEKLPTNWPIQGSTGYEFLALVNNLFTNRKSEKTFTGFYKKLADNDKPVQQQIWSKKALILSEHMNGELDNLTRLFLGSGLYDIQSKNIEPEQIKQAIGRLLIEFPVYRFYGNAFPLDDQENNRLSSVFKKIKKSNTDLLAGIEVLEQVLLQLPKNSDENYNSKALNFYKRCMQFTGPLMAKGVEDTLMYTYNRFIDHNEVGDSPETFGLSVKDFHEAMVQRQQEWPLAINATATHDTKRGEGVRARLNVLTAIADEWLQKVTEWQGLNEDLKTNAAPDANDEYFIYQTLIGAYPIPGNDEEDFETRLIEYLEKMLREAKRHSNWANPNQEYESAVKGFAAGLLVKSRPFWESFTAFHQKVSDYGVINSLSQALLKLTCPGVSDIYQGCELWDFSLVDPDNRRPVDYELREQLLNNATNEDVTFADLWEKRQNGQIKLLLINKLLQLRKQLPKLFSKGDYIPLEVKGEYKDSIIAFARTYKNTWAVVITPVEINSVWTDNINAPAFDWADTNVVLPDTAPVDFVNVLTGNSGKHNYQIELKEQFKDMPFAVLQLSQPKSDRSSGILLHITSLPSEYGIGDLGPQAKKFADMLNQAGSRYWQILPLNPTGSKDAYSPYSSNSSQAGNTLLISPELLANDGLLTETDLKKAIVKGNNKVDFETVEQLKTKLLNKAWENYSKSDSHPLQDDFNSFCDKESDWLDDYTLYVLLQQQHNNEPWNKWPDEYKYRDNQALQNYSKEHTLELKKIKWFQFIFAKQWHSLKTYCNQLDIKLFGDLPFYVSYDSADVWTNPEIFSLNDNLELKYVCGVPPDYFNEDGQRWGMPVFNWQKLKQTDYAWWVKRIRKNLQWYDLLRLDHFRAFSAYWEIPAQEETAKNGKWIPGPGTDFFNVLKADIGKLPFVAEDLGDIDEDVYDLRDSFKFPGMKVLQFAFGDNMPKSDYVPHHHKQNAFVYTGTHDNNTTLGWYRTDADSTSKKNIKNYTGLKLSDKNVNKVFIKLALASVCKTAIIPMQDLLDLDEISRMNTPAADTDNWAWRLTHKQLKKLPVKRLHKWNIMFDRA
jgi:malto-oligosyltrehalose synthase/4-alpha-glucanotransferase